MNTINFENVLAYFHDAEREKFIMSLRLALRAYRQTFEALARAGQPHGGRIF